MKEKIKTDKVILIKEKIKEDLEKEGIEVFFDKFQNDKRTLSFIEYYNKTVLDREIIDFSKFKRQWAIQGIKKEVLNYFNNNFDKLKEEVKKEKDIEKFFLKYCCKVRKEVVFCSKLFHTILPNKFPPIDNAIRENFNLYKKDFITNVLIIKRSYELFIKENPQKINSIRKILSKNKFSYLRIGELSDTRILDMYYWFKLNREKKIKN
jgi:hypothetical protein